MSHETRVARDDRELLRPTYQNRLRVIGRHLDNGGFHGASIFEIDGGFVVRATAADAKRPQALEFPDDQLPSRSAAHVSATSATRVSCRPAMRIFCAPWDFCSITRWRRAC
jgi:hypothetical protein